MKIKLLLILIILISFSCKSLKKYPKVENFTYLKTQNSKKYKFLTYKNKTDTILLVLKKSTLKKCTQKITKFDLNNAKRIKHIWHKIVFYQKINTGGLDIAIGPSKPGNKNLKYIYSYRKPPFLIKKCN